MSDILPFISVHLEWSGPAVLAGLKNNPDTDLIKGSADINTLTRRCFVHHPDINGLMENPKAQFQIV